MKGVNVSWLKSNSLILWKLCKKGHYESVLNKEVQLINPKKASNSDSIPPKILKISSEVSAETLHNFFNDMLKTGNFPNNLELADITPVF